MKHRDPTPYRYPAVMMSEKRWADVIRYLDRTGLVGAKRIARTIEQDVFDAVGDSCETCLGEGYLYEHVAEGEKCPDCDGGVRR